MLKLIWLILSVLPLSASKIGPIGGVQFALKIVVTQKEFKKINAERRTHTIKTKNTINTIVIVYKIQN